MNGVVRLALRYFTLYPLQRMLLGIGALFCVAGALGGVAGRPGSREVVTTGLLLMLMPAVPLAAVVFRELSARQSARLAPHFQAKMLGSLLLFVLTVAVTSHVLLSGVKPVAETFVLPFTLVTAMVVAIVVATGSIRGWSLVVGAAAGAYLWVRQGGYERLVASGIDPVGLGAAVSVVAWAAFAWWYLTSSQPVRRATAWLLPRRTAVHTSERASALAMTRTRAVASVFAVAVAPDPRRRLLWLVAAVPIAAAMVWLAFRWMPDPVTIVVLSGVAAPVVMAGLQSAHSAGRARHLWLAGGGSRAELFTLCERRSLGYIATVATVVFGAWAPLWISGIGVTTMAWFVAFAISISLFSLYVGLMHTEGWRGPDIAALCLLLASWLMMLVAFTIAVADRWPLLTGIVALPLAAALGCRVLAKRRWNRIDWLRLRPIPWLSLPSTRGWRQRA